MAELFGTVCDQNGSPLPGAIVEVKDERFQTRFSVLSGADGTYRLTVPEGVWPFVTVVRDYGERFLEFWCQNLPVSGDTGLDVRIGTLEVYGMHLFRVKGAGKQYFLYFRPMELNRFKAGKKDICPDLAEVSVRIDGEKVQVLHIDRVTECAGGLQMGAFLVQVSAPENTGDWKVWREVKAEVRDTEGNFGEAVLFPCSET